MWLRLPSTSSPSAPVVAVLNSQSSSVWNRLASSALWRGKPTQPQSWRRAWMKVSWTTRLSGAMCEPSTADAGVDAWICSLRAIRANPSQWPASGEAKKIPATCGRTSRASSTKQAFASSSSKMLAPTLPLDSTPYGESFASVVLRLRRDCLQRQKQARRRNGNGFSFSQWPTATTRDHKDGDAKACANVPENGLLGRVAANWPAPTASDAAGSRNATQPRPEGLTHHAGVTLNDAMTMWASPTTSEGTGAGASATKQGGANLRTQTALWSTPRASDAEKGGPNQAYGAGGQPLPSMAAQWGSPTVADVQGGRKNRSAERSGELLLNGQAAAVAASHCSPRAPATPKAGAKSSDRTERLSPRFVEWLMGWPDGWSGFAFSATEWFHFKARMRSQLSALVSRPVEVPERQLSWLASMPPSTRKFVGEG
jgi:hypothetical protein